MKYQWQHSLWSIMGIVWQDRVTNREVLDRAGTASVKTMLQKSQLHWAGHDIHMKTFIFQNRLFLDNCAQGRSTRADLEGSTKTTLRLISAGQTSSQKNWWWTLTQKAASSFGDNQMQHLQAASDQCQNAASTTTTPWNSSACSALDHALQALDYGATYEPSSVIINISNGLPTVVMATKK